MSEKACLRKSEEAKQVCRLKADFRDAAVYALPDCIGVQSAQPCESGCSRGLWRGIVGLKYSALVKCRLSQLGLRQLVVQKTVMS